MTDELRIVAVVLLKNEERYIAQVLRNIVNFCDHIIVVDNCSTDDTPAIVKSIQKENPKVDYHRAQDPGISHELISHCAGENVWIFGVDGDELYDPAGLAIMREKLAAGVFDEYWMILGNVLNCTRIDEQTKIVDGYLAPPCRSMTKLYNFSAIEAWPGPCSERLHGGNITFKEGFDSKKRYYLYDDFAWTESCFRCLHLCFLPRSSHDSQEPDQLLIRKNIADKLAENYWDKLKFLIYRAFGVENASSWKREKYMRGDLVTVSAEDFLLDG